MHVNVEILPAVSALLSLPHPQREVWVGGEGASLCQAEELAPRPVCTDPQHPGVKASEAKEDRGHVKADMDKSTEVKKEEGINYDGENKEQEGIGNPSGMWDSVVA